MGHKHCYIPFPEHKRNCTDFKKSPTTGSPLRTSATEQSIAVVQRCHLVEEIPVTLDLCYADKIKQCYVASLCSCIRKFTILPEMSMVVACVKAKPVINTVSTYGKLVPHKRVAFPAECAGGK